jgi:hypothetical protein
MAQAQQAGQPNRKQPRNYKKNRFAHEANTPYGMGDHYGTGVRAKIGRMREGVGMIQVPNNKMGNPPRSLA